MRIDATEDKKVRLRDVFEPLVIENEEGERIEVRIVNGGFEVSHDINVKIIKRIKHNG